MPEDAPVTNATFGVFITNRVIAVNRLLSIFHKSRRRSRVRLICSCLRHQELNKYRLEKSILSDLLGCNHFRLRIRGGWLETQHHQLFKT